MRITIKELLGAGANVSSHYLYKLSSPVGYRCIDGSLHTLFDTNMIRKAIEAKAYCHIGNERVSNGNIVRFNSKTKSVVKAILKLEKRVFSGN